MKMLLAVGLALVANTAAAQQAVIRSGMSESEVRAAFGEPVAVRQVATRRYLFYPNGCPVDCGSDDVVFLENGRVSMAVLRAPHRRMEGSGVTRARGDIEMRIPRSRRMSVGARPRRIVVGPRAGSVLPPADGFAAPRGAAADTVRGPLQRADTAAALRPPRPVPGTPPADTAAPRPRP